MDGNKDEAIQCIRIALKAKQDGDVEKARKFLNKSLKLYSTDRAKELLKELSENDAGDDCTKTGSASPKTASSPKPSSGGETARDSSSARPEYNSEQLDIVKKIKKCKNYYEVLDVEKENFNESDLKKKYRKLALLVHPDKNKAPGAAEAFKMVGNAYGVLSDTRKRQEYDANMNRPTLDGSSHNGHGGHYQEYTHFETSADITPEELFNVIFGNAFGGGSFAFETGHRRRRQAYQNRQAFHQTSDRPEHAQASMLLQMLPILVLVGMSLLSSFFVSDPPYSLLKTGKYPMDMKTRRLEVPYYVQTDFKRDYQSNIAQIEEQVEHDYIQQLRHTCLREKSYREQELFRARHMGRKEEAAHISSKPLPSCERLNSIQSLLYNTRRKVM